jgi:hypoxanthine phosphoribosyltransferase
MKKLFLPWIYISTAIDSLSKQIIESGVEIKQIHGVPRGGLIPAVMLSHKLNIPLTPCGWAVDKDDTLQTLVVDEICDSGKTLTEYTMAGCLILALHYKKSAIVTPDFYYDSIADNDWIVYPWENKDSETIADYLK